MFEDTKHGPATLTRRAIVGGGAAGIATLIFWPYRHVTRVMASTQVHAATGPVKIVEFDDTGRRKDETTLPRVVKTDEQWQQQLGRGAYDITRRSDTEIAFTGKYWNNHQAGLYRCVCCDTALFSSKTKFESGTGWPSFWAPVAKENVSEVSDSSLGMDRTAVACARCDAHLGHVFNDGPEPTGLRYCMNSASLTFRPAQQV